MSIYNEILSPRFQNAVKKLFSMKGGQGMRQVSGELIPVLPFPVGAEFRWLENWDLFALSVSPTGGAGQNAATRIRNPAGSNLVIVVYGLIASVTTAQAVSIFEVPASSSPGDLTTVASNTNARLDGRGRQQPTAVVSQTANYGAVPAVQNINFNLGANQPFQLVQDAIQEIPLLPGNTLDVFAGTVATLLGVTYMWRERLLEESERQ